MKKTWWQRFRGSSIHTQANIICTIVIAIATVAYAFIADRQLSAIKGQLLQMKGSSAQTDTLIKATQDLAKAAEDSAKLNRQMAEGTQAVYLIASTDFVGGDENKSVVAFSLVNMGHVLTQNVTVDVVASVVALPRGRVISSAHRSIIQRTLAPEDPTQQSITEKIPDVAFSRKAGAQHTQTVRVQMTGTYDNGFGKTLPIKFCQSYLEEPAKRMKGWVNCYEFDARLRDAIASEKTAGAEQK